MSKKDFLFNTVWFKVAKYFLTQTYSLWNLTRMRPVLATEIP